MNQPSNEDYYLMGHGTVLHDNYRNMLLPLPQLKKEAADSSLLRSLFAKLCQ